MLCCGGQDDVSSYVGAVSVAGAGGGIDSDGGVVLAGLLAVSSADGRGGPSGSGGGTSSGTGGTLLGVPKVCESWKHIQPSIGIVGDKLGVVPCPVTNLVYVSSVG